MAIYRIDDDKIIPLEPTTFARQGLRERTDLQALLKHRPEVISPNTLIVGEEFGEWEDSRRRIDLLGIDKDANFVVIELKRTEDGGHMELQALRYAAMISTLTFEQLVPHFQKYLDENDIERDARDTLLEFLGWKDEDLEEPVFGQEVKIVLASGEFSKELTTSVLWLNDFGLDIRCVRMRPYDNDGHILLDVQTLIPIPEAEEYQIRIRKKKQREREARQSARDFSKYDVTINGQRYPAQNKRQMMLLLVSEVLRNGGTPQQVLEVIPDRQFRAFDGSLDAEQIQEQLMEEDTGKAVPRVKRFFCDNGQPFQFKDKTYVLSNQWGSDTLDAARGLAERFPDLQIQFQQTEGDVWNAF